MSERGRRPRGSGGSGLGARSVPISLRSPEILLLGVAASLVVFLAGTVHAEAGPRDVIRQTTDRVLAVLDDDSLSSEQKKTQLEDVVEKKFDFRTISRLTMARNWKKLSEPQQDEFIEAFKEHLSITYGDNVESYNNETVKITGDREEPRGDWTVQTEVSRPNAENVKVDYRLRKKNGAWRIIDVVIEGVSLVANFRSQFQEIASSKGAEEVIRVLRKKNEKGESLKES